MTLSKQKPIGHAAPIVEHDVRSIVNPKIPNLRQISDIESATKLTVHYSLVLGLGVLSYQSSWLAWPVIWLLSGLLLSASLAIAHEALHQHLFLRRTLNRWVGVAVSTVILVNFHLYKLHHLQHHSHTGDDEDSESWELYSNPLHYFRAMTGFSFLFGQMRLCLQCAVGSYPPYVRSDRNKHSIKTDNIVLSVWVCAALVLTVFWPLTMVTVYWGPLSTCYFWVMLVGLPEHYSCTHSSDCPKNTRSISSNWLFRAIIWNSNYHAEHHLFPTIPGRHLSKVNELIRDKLPNCEKSYIRWHFHVLKGLIANSRARQAER